MRLGVRKINISYKNQKKYQLQKPERKRKFICQMVNTRKLKHPTVQKKGQKILNLL